MALQEIIACIGHPVAGNPTQFVMERAFEAAGLDARCLTVDVAPDGLVPAIDGMAAMGFRGAIVAEPYFAVACQAVDRLAPPAEMLGTLDLIYREGDQFVGDQAATRSIMELLLRHADLQDQQAVVLGGSEAAAAATLALALAGVSNVLLMAHDDVRADRIAAVVGEHTPCSVQVQPWVDWFRIPPAARVVIQASGEVNEDDHPSLRLDYEGMSRQTLLVDTVYNPLRTEFLKRGEAMGCPTLHGLDLLVQWAQVAFEIWTNIEPDDSVVREAFEEFLLI